MSKTPPESTEKIRKTPVWDLGQPYNEHILLKLVFTTVRGKGKTCFRKHMFLFIL